MKDIPLLCQEATFSKLFREHLKSLHNFIFYKTGNAVLSKDLAQDAFTKLWQNCQNVNFESAKAYLFKTANNLLINDHRHQQVVFKFQNTQSNQSFSESPDFILEEKEFKAQLENAIEQLPEKQRVVFLMSRIDKKTYKEIAAILGISKQAVEKRIYLALDKLRERVSKKIR